MVAPFPSKRLNQVKREKMKYSTRVNAFRNQILLSTDLGKSCKLAEYQEGKEEQILDAAKMAVYMLNNKENNYRFAVQEKRKSLEKTAIYVVKCNI